MQVFFLIFLSCFFISACSPTARQSTPPIANPKSFCHAIHLDPRDPQAYLPDPRCTPGVTNPDVTQQNLKTTICKSGFSKKIRPPASYTTKLKIKQIDDYGYVDKDLKSYEEDHFISLELGGHPRDPKNLWPEPHASINEKDHIENYLHAQICSGKMTLAQAQRAITTKEWYKIYQKLYPPPFWERARRWIME